MTFGEWGFTCFCIGMAVVYIVADLLKLDEEAKKYEKSSK